MQISGMGTARAGRARPGPVLRTVYVVLGLFSLAIGVTGFFVPGLPGTPLLLIAAWLFSLSNERLYRWTTTNRWFGRQVADYRAGLGIPRRVKMAAVTMVVIVISISAGFALEDLWLRLLVAGLGIVGITFILTRPTHDLVGDTR